ncbi:MAG: hypothetical protein Q9174_001771 [Haloplaca sp. 1 TL-2023]
MNGLRKSFWIVHSSLDTTLFNTEAVPGGFEAPMHFGMEFQYFINEIKIEAHFGSNRPLLRMSPYITVYESYGAAFDRARELDRTGAQDMKIAEIDGGDLQPYILRVRFHNRMVTVPLLRSAGRQYFMNIQDLKGAFNLSIPVGHYHVWLVLDAIPQDLITWITTEGVSEKIGEWRSNLGRELVIPVPAPPSSPTARAGYLPELRQGPAFDWTRVTRKPWQEPAIVHSTPELVAPRPLRHSPQAPQPSQSSRLLSLYAQQPLYTSPYAQGRPSQREEAGDDESETPPLTATPRPPTVVLPSRRPPVPESDS